MAASRPGESGSGIASDGWTRAARLGLWSAGVAAAAWLLADALTNAALEGNRPLVAASVFLGVSFLASGLVAWTHRPEQRVGRLMVVLGAAWLAGMAAQQSQAPVLVTLGLLVADAWIVLLVFFLVSFPRGRLDSSTDRLLVAPFAFTAIPLELAWLLFLDFGPGQPQNVLLV